MSSSKVKRIDKYIKYLFLVLAINRRMLQACVTKLSVTFLLVHCVCDVAAGRIVRAAEDSGHVTESPGPAVTTVTEAPCVTLPCHVSRELSAGLVTERPGGCVTRYTAVSRVVHDTVLRRQCSQHHVSECRVSHVTVEQEDTETRCVPAYDTRCRRVRRAGQRRQCGVEHVADCGQVMVQV